MTGNSIRVLVSLLLGAALCAACSSEQRGMRSPVSPTELSSPSVSENVLSAPLRRTGTVGGSNGGCGGDESDCAPFGRFVMTAPNGDAIRGALTENEWLITGGSGRFAGVSGQILTLRPTDDRLELQLNFVFGPDSPQRPIVTSGSLQLVATTTAASTDCASGTVLTRVYRGPLESFGLVEFTLETCAP